MADEKGAAEKGLLKIIENPAKPAGKKKNVFKGLFGGTKKSGAEKKKFDYKSLLKAHIINRALISVTVLVFCNFVLTFALESRRPGAADRFVESIAGRVATQVEGAGPLDGRTMTAGDRLPEPSATLSRNLFGLKPVVTKEEKEKPIFVEILRDYKLVGISLEENPEESYAMVENAATQVTYFLKKGDEFSGIKVVTIDEDKIVIDIQGKKVDLR